VIYSHDHFCASPCCARACGARKGFFSCLPGTAIPRLQIVTTPGRDWESLRSALTASKQLVTNTRSLRPTHALCPFTPKMGANGARDRAFAYGLRDDDSFLDGDAIEAQTGSTQPDTWAQRPGVSFFNRAGATRYGSPERMRIQVLHSRLRRSFRMTVCCAGFCAVRLLWCGGPA
jgi:hypothetical protein